ncbi:MAG TPA: Crp/Fnr family transcriptional regulator [Chitinophagaceae bacterium]|nr:Crp/Fnr family transcriptional regulator [Chitinophagaceae bacterium]
MPLEDKFLLIRNYDLWSQLSDEEYEELNWDHKFLEAKKNEYIYFDSHFHNKLYFVKNGFIKIGYIDQEGKEVIKEIIREGEVFGQFTLVKENLNGEFAQAYKRDVSLCAFTIEDFERLLKKKPEIAIKFSRQVGQKLRQAEFRLLGMLNRDVRSRLLGLFYQLALRNGYDGIQPAFTMENFLTHDDMARLIGSARQTVTSILNQLEQEGLVKISRKTISMPDVKKIQKQVIVT